MSLTASAQGGDALLVLSNLPDQASAARLAREVIARRLAACVNVLAPCRSFYRWQGALEETDEVPVFIKSTRAAYPALEDCIRSLHPYELPEIVALPLGPALPAYLAWVGAECAPLPGP